LNYGICRELQDFLFGIPGGPGDKMSISLLIFIGSLAYLTSFLSVHMLPDAARTRATPGTGEAPARTEPSEALGAAFLRKVNSACWAGSALLFVVLFWAWDLDLISSLIITFLSATFLRKVFLDWRTQHRPAA
jgi:hypothetical protein